MTCSFINGPRVSTEVVACRTSDLELVTIPSLFPQNFLTSLVGGANETVVLKKPELKKGFLVLKFIISALKDVSAIEAKFEISKSQ